MSAGNTARSTLAAVQGDGVRALQHVLYRAARADPKRRFHALRNKVYREDVLWRAWIAVRRNNGAPGIDKTTLADVGEYGVTRLLGELAVELRAGRWRPMPARQVLIPKPGSTERRPLAIAAVRDRIVQAAVKIVLEPVFEADFLPCSFGFRPRRSAHDALQVLIDEAWQGRRWVVETDIANCFSAIPQDKLMQAVEERISDQGVLKLVRAMLRAGVMEGGQVRREVTGAPQGGPASPLLCNIYLHRLDRVWDAREHGVLVRYCDDLVVMCNTRQQAEAALARLTAVPGGLGLELKQSKTRIVLVNMYAGGGCDGGPGDCGSLRGDGGCMALRRRPAGGVAKPPAGALAEDRGAERCGKSRDGIPAGVDRRDGRWPIGGLCRRKRRKVFSWHQNQGLHDVLG